MPMPCVDPQPVESRRTDQRYTVRTHGAQSGPRRRIHAVESACQIGIELPQQSQQVRCPGRVDRRVMAREFGRAGHTQSVGAHRHDRHVQRRVDDRQQWRRHCRDPLQRERVTLGRPDGQRHARCAGEQSTLRTCGEHDMIGDEPLAAIKLDPGDAAALERELSHRWLNRKVTPWPARCSASSTQKACGSPPSSCAANTDPTSSRDTACSAGDVVAVLGEPPPPELAERQVLGSLEKPHYLDHDESPTVWRPSVPRAALAARCSSRRRMMRCRASVSGNRNANTAAAASRSAGT